MKDVPAVKHEDAALERLDEASSAVQRIATQTWEPDKFRTAVAGHVADALRAIDLARADLRRGSDIKAADEAREALRNYFKSIGYGADSGIPEVMHIIAPLPIDPIRFEPAKFPAFQEVVNRLAISIQGLDRRYRSWLIVAPSMSGGIWENGKFDFKVRSANALWAELKIYPSGTVTFGRPLYAFRDPKGFALTETISDLEATLLFAHDFLQEIGVAPVQVAIQTAIVDAQDWILAVPRSIGPSEERTATAPSKLMLFPKETAIVPYSSFSREPVVVSREIVAEIRDGYK